MIFNIPLVQGVLIKRYKRFLADVRLDTGEEVAAHCANTGSMSQVSEPGSRVMLSPAVNPDRKTRWDWQLTQVNGLWAGINTAVPNILLREGYERRIIPEFNGYDSLRMEVKYGQNSRVDALLSGTCGKLFVEAKNVTLVEGGCALFPDAVTSRGLKHLDELAAEIEKGNRAAMFFLSQRMDAMCMGVAKHIDPDYANRLKEVVKAGVEIISWKASVSPESIKLDCELPFQF